MKGAIRVFCRIRPLIQQEVTRSQESVIEHVLEPSNNVKSD